MYYLQDIQFTSKEDGQKDFTHVLQDMDSKHRRFCFLAIELKEIHEQIGSIGYTVKASIFEGKIVDVGYFMYPAFWHQGYGTEAFHRVIEYAF